MLHVVMEVCEAGDKDQLGICARPRDFLTERNTSVWRCLDEPSFGLISVIRLMGAHNTGTLAFAQITG